MKLQALLALCAHGICRQFWSALPSPGFYPEISGFFEAVGIFFNFHFKKSISGFFWDF
jgi:hypothetical protein